MHVIPDLLSRPPGAGQDIKDNEQLILLPPEMFLNTTIALNTLQNELDEQQAIFNKELQQ